MSYWLVTNRAAMKRLAQIKEANDEELLTFPSKIPVYQLIACTHLDQAVPAASAGIHCPIPEAGKAQVDH